MAVEYRLFFLFLLRLTHGILKAKSSILVLLFIIFLVSITSALQAQEEMRFHNITADEGLSQSVVNCIWQDNRGFMWFGTQDGLNRYDGNNITVYKNNPIDSNSLTDNNINCLYEDSHNNLWIGTEGGLSELNLYTGKFTNYFHIDHNHTGTNNVHSIYMDETGILWLGAEYNSLCRLDSKTGKITSYQLELKDTSSWAFDYVSSITEDAQGNLWVGSWGGGLYCFDKKNGHADSYYHHIDSSPFRFINNISTIYYNKEKDELLIGTKGSGVESFDLKKKVYTCHYRPSNDSLHQRDPKMITYINRDHTGNIWVAGNNGEGLFRLLEDDNLYISYKRNKHNTSADFNDDFCNYIFIGADNIMWVGTNNGVDYYIPEKRNFVIYRDTANQSANVVMSIARDAGGKVWIGTNGSGLRCFDEVTRTYSKNEALNKAINNISILSLFIDKDYNLWIGSWGSGILAYNPLTEKHFRLDSLAPAIAQTTVTAITQDHTGKIWIGTYDKGVFSYVPRAKTVEHITVSNGLSDNRVYGFYEDAEHNMWICTDGGGANCYSPGGKITVIKKTGGVNSLSSNSVNCMYEDKEGNLWFGTGIGLNKYIPGKKEFVHYFTKDGLPNDYIYNIMPDKNGDYWISTNKGLSRFNPNITNESGSAFKNYDEGDGLPANEFNEGACLRTADGRFFFGSTNGIVSFYPEKVVGNMHIPPVSITSCELFGKELESDTTIAEKKTIELSWQKNTLSFSFVGLDYEMPAKNKYSYMLEGADADWSSPTTRHFASYAQLPPGKYVFKVRASNNDGVWNSVGSAIYINIIPPFWKTNWFYASCVILVLVSVFAFVKYRTSRIEKEKRVLEAKVEERTHELAQKNRDITSSIEYAKRIQQAILPPLDEIKQYLPDSFVLYMPKDIVSGDFYWFGEKDGKLIMVAADCTGHGVPGALMSMIGHNLLNQIVLEKGITKPSAILNNLSTMVQTALKQGISNIDTTDGMDVALCCFDKKNSQLEYAGANRPLVIAGNGELKKIDPDKMPIGGSQIGLERSFTNHTHKLKEGEIVYMFSDGYADQFGGEKGKKFMMKRFLDNLSIIKNLTVMEQETKLLDALLNWQGDNEQVDDILVIGVRL